MDGPNPDKCAIPNLAPLDTKNNDESSIVPPSLPPPPIDSSMIPSTSPGGPGLLPPLDTNENVESKASPSSVPLLPPTAEEPVLFKENDFELGLYHFILFTATNDAGAKPDSKNNKCLFRWMKFQNTCREKNKKNAKTDLTEERIAVLDKVDFPWKLGNNERWNKHYRDLVEFHSISGNCRVPRGRGLGEWVSTQRKDMKQYKSGGSGGDGKMGSKKCYLTRERIDKLNSIGFEWDLNDWDQTFTQLVRFKEANGHCSVSRVQDGILARWVAYQREQYRKHKDGKKCTITANQIEKLDSIEFDWSKNKKRRKSRVV